jgi:acyl dehydratase
VSVDAGKLGYERDSEEFRVNTARLAQFAAALDDTNPAHLAGRIAGPVFHHIPVMQSMVEVLTAATREFALHGEHDFHFHRPIEPGQRLFSKSRLIGLGATRAGTTLIIRSDTATHDGQPVSTQYSTCLVTTAKSAASVGETGPARPEPARQGEPIALRHAMSLDQTHRYADAARDYSPYTLDPAAAARLGFPAPIVHGMCTIGIAGRAIVDQALQGDTRRLVRLGGRFAAPVLVVPGQVLTTRLWLGPAAGGRRIVGFETLEMNGKVAIKNGFAEVRT